MKTSMKKIISLVAAAAMSASFVPVISGAEGFLEIESLKTYGSNFEFKFSEAVTKEAVENNVSVVDANGNKASMAVTVDANDASSVIVTVDAATAAKGGFVGISDALTAQSGAKLDKPYYADYAITGYYEDFGADYKAGDWLKYTTDTSVSSQIGISNAVVQDGEIYVTDNDYQTASTNALHVAPKNLASYQYTDSCVEYDYTRVKLDDAGTIKVSLRGIISNNQWNPIFYAAYGNISANSNVYAVVSRWNGIQTIKPVAAKRYDWGGTYSGTVPRDVGQKYRYRLKVQNLDTNSDSTDDAVQIDVYRAVYTDGVLGEFVKCHSYTDTSGHALNAGSMAFSASAGTLQKLDNVMFTDIHELELKDATMSVVSAKANEGNVVVEFTQPVANTDAVVLFDEEMNEYSATKTVSDNKVVVEIPESDWEKSFTLVVRAGAESITGGKTDKTYTVAVSNIGFTEDFGDGYVAGDWKDEKLNVSTNNASVANGVLTISTNNYDTIVYKNNYAKYSYNNSVLEYDYSRATSSNAWNYQFWTMLKQEKGSIYLNTNGYQMYSKRGYGLFYDWSSNTKIGRFTDLQLKDASATNTLTNLPVTAEASYRYRIETITNDSNVKITVKRAAYTDGVLGSYSPVGTYTDISNPDLKPGSFVFAIYRTAPKYTIDNVSYTSCDSLELVDYATVVDAVKADIDRIYAEENWDLYKEEIAQIGEDIATIEKVAGAFDADYKAKYDKLNALKVSSAKANEGNVVIEFTQPVANADAVVLFDEEMNEYSATKTVSDNKVVVEIPESDWEKSFTLVVRAGAESITGGKTDKTYTVAVSNIGFSEDFGDGYTAGDWKASRGNGTTAGQKINATVTAGQLEVGGTASADILYKKDYTNYSYNNSVLEYDYNRTADADAAYKHSFVTMLKQESGATYFKSWQDLYANSGYSAALDYNNGTRISAFTSEKQIKTANLNTVSAYATVVAGTTYRYRIETVTADNKVTIIAKRATYTDGVLGAYTTIGSYTDSSATADLNPGSFVFAVYGDAPKHTIDNVSYTSCDSLELVDYATVVDAVKADIDRIYAEENWNLYKEEIAQIGEDIAAIEKIAGAFDEDYKAKYDQLKSGKNIAQINKGFFEQFAGKDSITIGFIGGSLTEGGNDYQQMFKNYMAEKTGVAAESIKIVNAGNGGQTSDWLNIRLYDDIMSKNPDIVVFDFAGNDDQYMGNDNIKYINGYSGTVNYAETAIRRILQMENGPEVILNEIPKQNTIKLHALREQGVTWYKNEVGNIVEFKTPLEEHVKLAEYYNIPCINIMDYIENYMTLENAEIGWYTYKAENGNIVWTVAQEGAKGAVKVCTTKITDIVENINYEALQASLGKTYKLNEGKGNSFLTIAADTNHPTTGTDGYKLYGDIMLKLMESDASAALRLESLPAEPYSTPTYDQFTPKKITVSKAALDSMENVTIEGTGSYEDVASFTTTNIRTRSGVKFTGPLTVTYKFKGHVLYLAGSNDEFLMKNATIDGMAYPNHTTMLNKGMLKNDTDHTLVINIPEGASYSLAEIYTDEDTLNYSFASPVDKYTTIDLRYYANTYGLYSQGDAPVYSLSQYDSEVDSAVNGVNNIILDEYKEGAGMGKALPDAQEVKAYFENEAYTGIPYDMSMLENYRYKTITLDASRVKRPYGQYRGINTIDTSDAEIGKLRVDLADDFYKTLNIVGRATTSNNISVSFYYTDGTSESAQFNLSAGNTVYTAPAYNRITGAESGTSAIKQVQIAVPDTDKRVDFIKFANAGVTDAQIYAMTLENVYDAGVIDVEFETAEGTTIYDLTKHTGETVNINVTSKANMTGNVTGELYAAIFDGGRLNYANMMEADCTGIDTFTGEFKIPADYNSGYTSMIFYWNSELDPFTEVFLITD